MKHVWKQSQAEVLGHFCGVLGQSQLHMDRERQGGRGEGEVIQQSGGSVGLTRKEKNKAAAERKCQTSWSSKKPSRMHGRFFSRDSAGVS